MCQIIGDKLFKVESDALGERNKCLLHKIRDAMENLDFCSKCEPFGGEMSLYFGEIVVKIDWKDKKIVLEKSD
ncbi:MAG: hypothetical protein ACE5R6_07305 [Candidatus Heimdallarchaeota archaeon]